MKRRIFGLENEYGLTCTLNGQRRLSPDNVARYLFEKVIPGARNANVFLENGARLYLDTGFHPEYATPECDDVAELVIHDKAGERIVEDLLHQAEKRLREDGISGNILLLRTTPIPPATPTAATRTTWYPATSRSSDSPKPSSPSSSPGRSSRARAKCSKRRAASTTACPSAPSISARRSPGRRRRRARSSTPATSRTPTPSVTGACTSSWAIRICPKSRPI